MISPLANLNYNMNYSIPINDNAYYIAQFFPSSLSTRFGYNQDQESLIVSSLNVSTAFVQPYHAVGLLGMYLYIFIIYISLFFLSSYRNLPLSVIYAIRISVTYFILLTVFANSATYLTTSYLIIIAIGYCIISIFKSKRKVCL